MRRTRGRDRVRMRRSGGVWTTAHVRTLIGNAAEAGNETGKQTITKTWNVNSNYFGCLEVTPENNNIRQLLA